MAHNTPEALPGAGESLLRKVREEFSNWAFYAIGIAIGMWLAVAVCWLTLGITSSSHPWPVTIVAAVMTIILAFSYRKRFHSVTSSMQGARGERKVADILHELGKGGYVAVHDIEFTRDDRSWNVDHVLVGPVGVCVIETKAVRNKKISFDGSRILENGFAPARDPISQVRRNARDLRRIVHDEVDSSIPVHPIVLYTESFVEAHGDSEVAVLNAKQLFNWLREQESTNAEHLPARTVGTIFGILVEQARRRVVL